MPNILFRVESDEIIGSGHVLRCLALAEYIKRSPFSNSFNVVFVARRMHESLRNLLANKSIEVLALEAPDVESNKDDYSTWLGKAPTLDALEFIDATGLTKTDIVVADNYAVNVDWELVISGKCKSLIVIDDLAERRHLCQIVVNNNIVDSSAYAGKLRMVQSYF